MKYSHHKINMYYYAMLIKYKNDKKKKQELQNPCYNEMMALINCVKKNNKCISSCQTYYNYFSKCYENQNGQSSQ